MQAAYEPSYTALTRSPIAGFIQRPTMGLSGFAKETMMPSNQEYKGKGMKGRNYDEMSGVGTSSAGVNGTTGNLNDGGRDGGIGSPDMADSGNLQQQTGQPGGTPAQGDSVRSQGNLQGGSQQQGSQQQGSQQADALRGGGDDRQLGAKQGGQDETGTARPSGD
jgi:hypothetical protein